jgi:hypothetical protein
MADDLNVAPGQSSPWVSSDGVGSPTLTEYKKTHPGFQHKHPKALRA